MTLMREMSAAWNRFNCGGIGRLVQDAVNAVADAQLVLRRLEVDVRRAVLVGFPDDLVDELDDAGFLVALGDFLVLADEQFQRLVLVPSRRAFRRRRRSIS